jgi:putative ABC transport system ATP-binding protein
VKIEQEYRVRAKRVMAQEPEARALHRSSYSYSCSVLPIPAPKAPVMLRLHNVSKLYLGGVTAVDHISLEVGEREFVAIMGRSGSGKSTLLNLIAGIDRPSEGQIWIGDQELTALDDDALTRLRRDRLGIVFQFFNLLTTLDVRENVALPLLLERVREREAFERADALIEAVGLTSRARARPATLSGGEMQRAAIARALIHRPALLLADEPTGNLDSRSAAAVLALIRHLSAEAGAAVILVTHSAEAAAIADRVLEMSDGRFVAQERSAISSQQSAVSDQGVLVTDPPRIQCAGSTTAEPSSPSKLNADR